MGPGAALAAVFPQPALRAAQGHWPRCLFVQVSRAGLAPCQSPAHIHGDRHSHGTGPGSPTRCRTGGSSATATFPVWVNTTFLKHPNWQLGITRHKEEDTWHQEVTRRCGASERSQTCYPSVFVLPQTTPGPGKPGCLPQYDQLFCGGKNKCLTLSKAPACALASVGSSAPVPLPGWRTGRTCCPGHLHAAAQISIRHRDAGPTA